MSLSVINNETTAKTIQDEVNNAENHKWDGLPVMHCKEANK